MGQEPQQIRQTIQDTRADMGATIDEIQDRVSPQRVVAERKQRVRDRWESVRSRVMGSTPSPGNSTGSATIADVKEGVQQAPEQVRQQTEGNPLVAGALAFGAGVLAASLLPPSKAEQAAASALQERAEPLKQEAKEAASDISSTVTASAQQAKEDLAEQAKESADLVKDKAQSHSQDLAEQAKSQAQDVKQDAKASADEVKNEAQSSAESVKDRGGS